MCGRQGMVGTESTSRAQGTSATQPDHRKILIIEQHTN